jgi:hypothetical protein
MSQLVKSLLLLFICVFSIYFPSISSEVCRLDDYSMIKGLLTVQHFDLTGIFFPHRPDGYYYRPVIETSFLMDRFLWNLEPSVMHLENILIHLTNSVLVLLIARLTIPKNNTLPLVAALLFAVHPIATESVNWLSGRTDLLAMLFVLSSFYYFLRYWHSGSYAHFGFFIFLLLLGVMTKETAFGYVLALMFILTARRENDSIIQPVQQCNRQAKYVFIFVAGLSIVSAVRTSNYYASIGIILIYFLYLLWVRRESFDGATFRKYFLLVSGGAGIVLALTWGIRKLVYSSQTPQIRKTFGLLFTDINFTLSLFFRAVGFYAKKFLCPLPLNFVIRDVSPFYALIGIFLLCLVVVLIVRRRFSDFLVIAGFCMITPVLPLTFESVAWTSYAERYVYPATPFWILALSGYAASSRFDRLSISGRRCCLVGVSALILFMAAVTFQRSVIWQSNLALFKDSVEKSPDYKRVRGLYMGALFQNGLIKEALQQYQIAQSLQAIQIKYNPMYDLFYVQILISQQDFAKAEYELGNVERKMAGKEPEVYEKYVEILPSIILSTVDRSEQNRLINKVSESFDAWYVLTKNPMILYRKGQFLLAQQRKSEAGVLFARAAVAFPENDPFKGYSRKLARSLAERM